jgi:hypothetical protein
MIGSVCMLSVVAVAVMLMGAEARHVCYQGECE